MPKPGDALDRSSADPGCARPLRADAAQRVRLTLDPLWSADNHRIVATLESAMRIGQSASDRALCAETFANTGAGENISIDAVVAKLTPGLLAKGIEIARQRNAEDWTTGQHDAEFRDSLRTAAEASAFRCGIELFPPFEFSIGSPTLAKQHLERAAHERHKERAAGQVQRLREAGDVLREFELARQSMPGVSPGQMLQRLDPADRGAVFGSMLLASSKDANACELLAVAGNELIIATIDGAGFDTRLATRLVPLPDDLGPFRSVRQAKNSPRDEKCDVLLIGARQGVMLVSLQAGRPSVTQFVDRELSSELGFNAASLSSDESSLFASHSARGVVRWAISQPDRAKVCSSATTSTSAAGARQLIATSDGRALCIFGNGREVAVIEGERIEPLASPDVSSPWIALIEGTHECIAVAVDGTAARIDLTTMKLAVDRRHSVGGNICSAGALSVLGETRLLLACEDGDIECVGTSDPFVVRYASSHRGPMRALTANASVIAALSDDRQRILLWRPWEPSRPFAQLHAGSLVRHRIADLALM